jgi:hypothetical protein
LAIQQSKTPEQVKIDRQQRKKDRADKKAKITFAPGASKRLSDMGLHGNNLQAAQNFHKYIIKNEMNKKGLRDQNVAKATIVYVLQNSSTSLPLDHTSPFTVLPLTQAEPSKARRTTSRHISMTPTAGTYKAPG